MDFTLISKLITHFNTNAITAVIYSKPYVIVYYGNNSDDCVVAEFRQANI
jgi:hypothetical protein